MGRILSDEESTSSVPDGYTPILIGANFTEEVEEFDINLDDLQHTDVFPPWWGDTPMPPRVPKITDFGGHTSIVQTAEPINEKEAGSSITGVIKMAKALEWRVDLTRSRTHHTDLLFVANGKLGDSGDVRTAAHDQRHYSVIAYDDARTVGFMASWSGKGEGTGATFDFALIVDPYGIPVENFIDYRPSRSLIKQIGEDKAKRRMSAMSSEYNDGTSRMNRRHTFSKMTPFKDWLTDYLEILAPESAPKRKAPRKTKDEVLFEGGDWNG